MGALVQLVRGRRWPDDGFSLVEVLVAMVLFMLLAATTGTALASVLATSRSNESRVVAANLAAREVEVYRGVDTATVTVGALPRRSVRLDGRAYHVETTLAYDTVGSSGSACDGVSGPAAFLRVSVLVSWEGMGTARPVRSDTMRALPVTGLNNGTGVLTVPVRDRTGAALVGVPVTVSGPTTRTETTRADGCAVFAGLPPSSAYTVSVSTPGWVDRSGQAVSTHAPVQVRAGEVTKDPFFTLDRAAALDLTLTPAPAASGYPFPAAVGITLSSTASGYGTQPHPVCGTAPCVTASGTQRSRTGLFPHVEGFRAWVGTCAGSQPGTAVTHPLTPGATTTAVTEPAAAVRLVTKTLGSHRSGWEITAVNLACAEETFLLGTTGADDASAVRASLPAGTWEIRASSGLDTFALAGVTLTSGTVTGGTTPVVVEVS